MSSSTAGTHPSFDGLDFLAEITRDTLASLEVDGLLQRAVGLLQQRFGFDFVGLAVLGRDGQRLATSAHAASRPFVAGFDAENWAERALQDLARGQLQDREAPRGVGGARDLEMVVQSVRSHLALPLQVGGQRSGALVLEHAQPDRFGDEQRSLFEHLAGHLAQALENARLFEHQRRRWQQLLLVNEVARVATSNATLEQIVDRVTREVYDRFRYRAVAVSLVEGSHVVVRALAAEELPEAVVGARQRVGEGIAGRVAATGEWLQIDEAGQLDGNRPLCRDTQSLLCIPLGTADWVIGALQVESAQAHAFDQDDRLLLETLARSVVSAIAKAEMMRRAEQLREDLTRMIVHDLRNPVQALQLTLNELATLAQLPADRREYVQEGIRCTEDILDMVNSLLDVARFEAGRVRLARAPMVLNDHVRAVVRRFTPLAHAKAIQVTTVLSQAIPVMRLDCQLVDRMLANVIGNALKFTPEGAQVTVQTELMDQRRVEVDLDPPFVLIVVGDSGEGIPADFHEKIFEKFGQVETRKAGLKMSTGLGLTLCRYVAEAHGGCIWVESQEGEGSTFYIALPLSPAQ